MDDAVGDLLGRSRREITGLSYLAITHPADHMRNAIAVAALPGSGLIRLIRKRYMRPDGSLIWADLHARRLVEGPGGGRLIGTISWADDHAGRPAPGAFRSMACKLLDDIAARRGLLGNDIFADHAWMILLETYLAEAEGRLVDADTIAQRTATPVSVVSRWVKALNARALVEFYEADRRYFQLTLLGSSDIETLLSTRAQERG